jgi:AcrR family transcriptional regulator
MSTSKPKTRVSKDQWLQAAMELFSREGEKGVQIEKLARQIGVAKAGFYWHFRDRTDLLEEILLYWANEFTQIVATSVEKLDLPPEQRLLKIMEMIVKHDLTQYDVHFRAWAKNDPAAARTVREVIRVRADTVRGLFSELGFEGEDLELRTRLFVSYGSNEGDMYGGPGRESQRNRKKYWQLLIEMATVIN